MNETRKRKRVTTVICLLSSVAAAGYFSKPWIENSICTLVQPRPLAAWFHRSLANQDDGFFEDDLFEKDAENEQVTDDQAKTDDTTDDGNNNVHNDDFFDDGIADADDDNYDDFYAFIDDPGPPQLYPLTSRYILGLSVASMALTLGATGGIGGGGVVVPVYILVMGLPLKVAVPIGAVTLLGASLGCTLLNWTRRHPLADRPLIDWDLVLIMGPLSLTGTLVGTLFHQVFSEKFLVVLLVIILSVTAQATLSKAMRMYRAEKRYIRHMMIVSSQSTQLSESPTSILPKSSTWQEVDSNVLGAARQRALDPEEKQQILIVNPDFVTLRTDLIEQEKFTPRGKIIAAFSIFSVVVTLNVLVGGGAFTSPLGIRCGSWPFWSVHFIIFLFLITSAWVAQTYVVGRHEIKKLVRFDYVHGDIQWDAGSAILYPAIFVMAGFFAGTLGISGGVITVPIMYTMGVHPAIVAATSSAMAMFTTLGSTSSYMVFGLILKDFAIAGFCIGFVSAIIGSYLMKQARRATSASGRVYERNSYLAFAIGGVVLIAALLMTIQYVFKTVKDYDEDDDGGICEGLRF
ncbi:hypothetical protein FisN_12Lh044 [Fistulifera solaris]|jgi:uncharacterized membrane protein YfcA|uniref:Sulfite exporter TauE/SafE n=1 Tax=Fistulifera solaris TaxID=1519565 RepID=A0A1Z5KHT4_FISSO|nr:hypothetical protein FisN_12Lh044 [Fistulifera solaris]|eukprot:GAX25508.1 hypothetical protein FisN_12Lh044 [Fistulifera solaris]